MRARRSMGNEEKTAKNTAMKLSDWMGIILAMAAIVMVFGR
jgi:hypothetical protein